MAGYLHRLLPMSCSNAPNSWSLIRRSFPMALLLVLCHLFSGTVVAQLAVRVIMKDSQPRNSAPEVRYVRYADFAEQDVSRKLSLSTNDELFCPGGNVTIELRSTKANARFTFSNRFRLIVLSDSTINLLNGDGNVQAADPTAIHTGEIIMGSAHTEYGVRVYRTEKGEAAQEFAVYEGEVTLSSPPGGSAFESKITTGQKQLFTGRLTPLDAVFVGPLNKDDIFRAASINAQTDTGKAMMADKAVGYVDTYQLFLSRYAAVLGEPNNPKTRLDLGIAQVNFRVAKDATYQLTKAEEFSPKKETSLRAVIAVTKGAAFSQTGQTDSANTEFRKAYALDPGVFEETNLKRYKLREDVQNQVLMWHKLEKVPPQGETVSSPRWPIPKRSSQEQVDVFRLILKGDYDNAYRNLEQRRGRNQQADSIDAYSLSIICFERKDLTAARAFANEAIKRSKSDGLLSEHEYAAIKRIIEGTR